MQNLIQQILDTKVFIVKLQSYGLYRLILTPLMVVTKGHPCYLNKPGTLHDFLLPPNIKGLTGLHKCL